MDDDQVGAGRQERLYPPFSGYGQPPVESALPSIGEFLDDLPPIEEFAEDAPREVGGWAIAELEDYDWAGLASLGPRRGESTAADAEWGSTAWPASQGPTSQEIASALDDIARRIRSGELHVDQFLGTPPEAAMAAALAALLTTRG